MDEGCDWGFEGCSIPDSRLKWVHVLEGVSQEHALLVTASGKARICCKWVVVDRQGVAVASMCIDMCCTAHGDVVQVSSYTHESGLL